MNIRTGDVIISKNGLAYEVDEVGHEAIRAIAIEPPRRRRSFTLADLFCVDANDGLWQEMEERRK